MGEIVNSDSGLDEGKRGCVPRSLAPPERENWPRRQFHLLDCGTSNGGTSLFNLQTLSRVIRGGTGTSSMHGILRSITGRTPRSSKKAKGHSQLIERKSSRGKTGLSLNINSPPCQQLNLLLDSQSYDMLPPLTACSSPSLPGITSCKNRIVSDGRLAC